jgi:hypothetical protein
MVGVHRMRADGAPYGKAPGRVGLESEPRNGLVEVGTFWNACDLPHKDLLKTAPVPGRQIVSSPRL